MEEYISAFQFEGDIVEVSPYGNGHINDTYYVATTENEYIVQRINHYVFKDPALLMRNNRLVTDYLKAIITRQHKDPSRETLTIIPTKDNQDFYQAPNGNYYRAILFIPNTVSLETITNAQDFYKTGLAFGHFQALLKDFDASQLEETIPHFHHTPSRYQTFLNVYAQAEKSKIATAKKEIDFVLAHEEDARTLYEMYTRHELPLRVTHNDTKLNNILFDKTSMEPLCIIDLDTVMPGLVGYDFGDAIRSGATFAKEDETDLTLVKLELDLYEAFTRGFIEGAKGILTAAEIASLPLAAKTMIFECGIRFLTDYLEGDVYFKTDYPLHNLVRTRTQFKLVEEIEKNWAKLQALTQSH